MMTIPKVLSIGILALAAACSETGDPTAPALQADLRGGRGGPENITVMTRNVYIGFDADAAIAALASGDPAVFGPVLQASIATLQRTDFTVRARTIAEEIARTRPHAVGLQEVYQIHADLSGLGIPMQIDLDYLQILQAALAARHLPYAVAGVVINTDMQPLPGIQLVDREVLLVDASRVSVNAAGVVAKPFEMNIGQITPTIFKKAGYIVAPVTIDGQAVTIATTHLESDLGPGTYDLIAPLRAAQAMEIAQVIGDAPRAIVMGDLNDFVGSMMYQVVVGAGFTDTWKALEGREPGLSDSCFQPDLSDRQAHCQERIDIIFARGFDQRRGGLSGDAWLVGILPWEREHVASGFLWPSDHAGVVVRIAGPRRGDRD